MTFDLGRFGESEARRCGERLRAAAGSAANMESAASAVCRVLHTELVGGDGERACVLARCYTTQPFSALSDDLRRFARRALGAVSITPPEPTMRCLVLLATAGDEPAWNDPRQSRGHQAIPLPSPHIVERAPMIAQLIREMGFDIASVVRPRTTGGRRFEASADGVFHVEEAAGSPFIPAQHDFVEPYGIRSVVGFGGLLPSGELFAVIAFARVHIPVASADRFRDVASDVRAALLGAGGDGFSAPPAP